MEKKIVFISMHLPSPNVPEAGQKLAYKRLMNFINQNSEVHLVSFVNEQENIYVDYLLYEKCASVKLVYLNNINRFLNFLNKPWLPIHVAVRNDNRFRKYVGSIINDDVNIHIEYEQGAVFVPSELLSKTTVVFHDVISQSLWRYLKGNTNVLKRIIFQFQYLLLIKWESSLLSKLGRVIVLNDKDSDIVKSLIPDVKNVIIDYPEVSEFFYNIKRDSIINGSLMFWGAMNRSENVDAVLWFVKSIFPKILEKKPDSKLFVVGANPPESIKILESNNITVTGFVDDPREYFERMHVSIVPLRYGAGIKLKVLEALAARIPVVTTSVGAEGIINDNNLIMMISDLEDEFANNVLKLIN
ncbi:glycosyltransferase [Pectobacterium versatile]|uniref:glycosyltransferase n=1 Tax=Pectobacterium versatile TaxID=2488639 RepID=UPI001934E854|nr:glycosyltransferase [Pectobacterium versatile]QQK72852.1 glycosyltransferase [Pectobacterium versatile]